MSLTCLHFSIVSRAVICIGLSVPLSCEVSYTSNERCVPLARPLGADAMTRALHRAQDIASCTALTLLLGAMGVLVYLMLRGVDVPEIGEDDAGVR